MFSRKRIISITITLAIIFGVSIRWTNLGHKVYWYDEVVPTLRVVGYRWSEAQEIMARKVFMTAGELQDFQTFSKGKDWTHVVMLGEQVEHPPLYFTFQRLLAIIFGPSPAVFRSASVTFSLLTLPILAWLCWELFEDLSVSKIAMALFAVSPIQVAYAQEAKPYSYLVFSVILSSAILLNAVKNKKTSLWIAYGISLAFSLYSSLIAIIYMFAHIIWMIFRQHSRKELHHFFVAVALGLSLYSPWLYHALSQWDTIQLATQWTRQPIELSRLITLWISGWAHSILDLGYSQQMQSLELFINSIICLFLLFILFTMSVFSEARSRRAVRFCLLLLFIPFGIMILRDLINQGRATIAARYYLPSISILLIIIASWLTQLLISTKAKIQFIGISALLIFIIGSMASSSLLVARETSRYKIDRQFIEISKALEYVDNPLILSVSDHHCFIDAIILSYLVPPETQFMFSEISHWKMMPKGYSNYFFLCDDLSVAQLSAKYYGFTFSTVENVKSNSFFRLNFNK